MLFIILGLSLIEIITSIVLENGVPFTTSSYKSNFFYDIKENNIYKILNGTVHINYKVYMFHPFNYFYMSETIDHSSIITFGNSKKLIEFQNSENETETRELSFNFTFIPINQKSNAVRFNFDIKTFMIINVTITVNEIGRILTLENGVTQNITNLMMGHLYYFLIFSKDRKNANISLSMNYNNKLPFKNLTIYEYRTLNPKLQYTLESVNQISFNKVGDEYIINSPYIISLTRSEYISFKIIPQHNIDYINAKVDFGGKITYIHSSNTQFSNLISGYNYGFYMNAKEKQIGKINFTINYSENIPFEYINILEISESQKILKKTNENVKLKYIKINDTYVVSLEYNVSSYEAFVISLDFALKYDIKNLTIYKNFDGGVLECKNGKMHRLDTVKGYPYYLYIAAEEKQKVSVDGLYMNGSHSRYINEIYIYEFSYRNSSSYNCYQKITVLNKDFSYEVKNKSTTYIAFHFVLVSFNPNYYLEFKVIKGDFDCSNGIKKEFINLLKNNNYYLYINATVNKYVSINITINAKYNNSLEYMTIYEYSERHKSDILKETQKNITIKNSEYEAYSYNSYKVISKLTNYVCFKIHIKEDARYTVQIFVKNYNDSNYRFRSEKNNSKSKSYDLKLKNENNLKNDDNKSNYDKNKVEREEEKSFDFSLDKKALNKQEDSDIIIMKYSPIQNEPQNDLQ